MVLDGFLSTQYIIIYAVLAYALLCNLLRFQRSRAMHKKYGINDRKSLSGMTNADAQAIINTLAELEFPKLMEMSLQFALFKAGIPQPIHQIHANDIKDLWHTHDFQVCREVPLQ